VTGKFPLVDIAALEDQGAIADIQDGNHGERHPKVGDYVEDGIPFVMANDLSDDLLNLSTCSRISEEQARGLRIGFSITGDVLLTHKGTLGSVALVTEADPFIMLTPQVTYYRTDNSRLLNRFLCYAFREPGFQARMHAVGAQGTRPYIGITAQRRLQIVFPPRDVQQRISDILSAYDDLIENNRRRMALLEDAARQIYREWFVRLRFPGHEHTPITNGVPEGWERMPFENALVLQRGFDLPVQDREEGDVPIYGSTGINGYHSKAKVTGPGVVTGRSGTLGQVHYVSGDYWPLNTALWVKEFKKVSPLFAVFVMREMDLKQFNGGVSVPTLDRKTVHRAEILIPPKRLLTAFDEYVQPLFQQISTLAVQTEKLRAARDLLLPRLMSGEIAV